MRLRLRLRVQCIILSASSSREEHCGSMRGLPARQYRLPQPPHGDIVARVKRFTHALQQYRLTLLNGGEIIYFSQFLEGVDLV